MISTQGKPQARWQAADENFRMQIRQLMAAMDTRDKDRVAQEAGMKSSTFYMRYRTPATLRRGEERQLQSLFARYGLRYDMTLGEGCQEADAC